MSIEQVFTEINTLVNNAKEIGMATEPEDEATVCDKCERVMGEDEPMYEVRKDYWCLDCYTFLQEYYQEQAIEAKIDEMRDNGNKYHNW